MHLLVDVRTSSISDISAIIYAECWVSLWKDISPHDRITFLAYDGDPLTSDDIIRIPRPGFLHLQKKIAHHANGPKRIISFSRLPSIDRSIPSITHISDIAPLLYPYQIGGFLMRKKLIHAYKKMLRRSQMIIVPENGIRSDISEFFGIEDSRIAVIPYVSETSMSLYHDSMKVAHGLERRYLITEGTPGNEWNPIGLIRAYREYIERHGGTQKLIIIGDMGENLGHITSLIRSLELIQEIKLVGIPTEAERKTLYAHASGWIYI